MSNVQQSTETRAKNRPNRKPLHKRRPLVAAEKPGYFQKWVNEDPGRVNAFLEAGYSIEKRPDGSDYREVVNSGKDARSHTAVLMSIPLEFYKEDQDAKQAALDEDMKSWDPAGDTAPGRYGHMEISSD